MEFDVKQMQPGDKGYPPFMDKFSNKDKYHLFSMGGLAMIPFMEFCDDLLETERLKEQDTRGDRAGEKNDCYTGDGKTPC